MSYSYEAHRAYTLTDEGQRKVFAVLDFVREILPKSGAVRADKLLSAAGSGDSWELMACVERLVELGYLAPLASTSTIAWQLGIFVAGAKLR